MDWYVAYDVMRDTSWSYWGLMILVPLAMMVVGYGFASYYAGLRRFVGGLFVIVGLVSFLFFSFTSVREFNTIRQTYNAELYNVVEGEVVDFVNAKDRYDPELKRIQRESFKVNGVAFSYHHRSACLCFNQTAISGGPLRTGLYVRIWYIGDKIIRLEIRRDGLSNG